MTHCTQVTAALRLKVEGASNGPERVHPLQPEDGLGSLRTNEPDLEKLFVEAIEHIGTGRFYGTLLSAMKELFPVDAGQVMLMRRQGRPEYLEAFETCDETKRNYGFRHYRNCPMQYHWENAGRERVVTLRDTSLPSPIYNRYFSEFFSRIGLYDEIGLFMPTSPNHAVGLFVQRASRFDAADFARAERTYGFVNALHKAHVRILFSTMIPPLRDEVGNDTAMAVLDRFGHCVVASPAWLDRFGLSQDMTPYLEDADPRHAEFQIEPLDESFALAPGGYLVEHSPRMRREGPNEPIEQRLMEAFRGYRLTRREREILLCILRGKANQEIGEELGISINTLKAHRKRLYAKLDITSERELQLRVIQHLL